LEAETSAESLSQRSLCVVRDPLISSPVFQQPTKDPAAAHIRQTSN